MEEQPFVAREGELAQLNCFLKRALAGQGQVCFVAGEAGMGKTALVAEFARRAQEQHEDLVVAFGQGDDIHDVGAPYLPFLELLGLLTGDVDAKLARGVITPENAGRLERMAVTTVEVLLAVGRGLLETFAPLAEQAMRVAELAANEVSLSDRLKRLAGRSQGSAILDIPAIEQARIFEQYTKVLQELAKQKPLLLILDDLHWADTTSIGLLFRLGRRIGGNGILIVGTYRPEEVTLGRAGQRHPLEKVLTELKRHHEDTRVDLDQVTVAEGQRLVSAILDTEPNQLGRKFRQALYHHTNGNPLFTIELLRVMQERGDIIRDAFGQWVESATLNWETIPAPVGAVFEERVGRLTESLQKILDIASVEGERFTAQVIAQVLGIHEREVLRVLSQELEGRHRLVQEQEQKQIGQGFLSYFRFIHVQLQQYLYNKLGTARQRLLHENVGTALKELYGDHADEAAVQLAQHFEKAQIAGKAIYYLLEAGKACVIAGAFDAALEHLKNAWKSFEDTLEQGVVLLRARVAYETGLTYVRRGGAENLQAALEWQNKGLALALPETPTAEAALLHLLGAYVGARRLDLDHIVRESKPALELAQEAGAKLELGRAYQMLALAARAQRRFNSALEYCQGSIEVFQELSNEIELAKGYTSQGIVALEMGDWLLAKASYVRALEIQERIGDELQIATTCCNLADLCYHLGDLEHGFVFARRGLGIFTELESTHKITAQVTLATLFLRQGKLGEARKQLSEACEHVEKLGDVESTPIVGRWSVQVHLAEGNLTQAEAEVKPLLALKRDKLGIDAEPIQRLWGQILAAQGKLSKAQIVLQESLRQLGLYETDYEVACTLLVLSGVLAGMKGRMEQALEHVERARAIFAELGAKPDLEEADRLIARLLTKQGKLAEAIQILEASLERLEQMQIPYQFAHVQLELARVLSQIDGRAQDALAHAEHARAILAELGAGLGILEAEKLIAELRERIGESVSRR